MKSDEKKADSEEIGSYSDHFLDKEPQEKEKKVEKKAVANEDKQNFYEQIWEKSHPEDAKRIADEKEQKELAEKAKEL